ncbi:hypothetical protein ACFYXD_23185 [Streptomyces platensis]|uniref:hypothetical protein n=1 Tax=Streptomyces platensis TaxID=58346 RepID=UPI0036ABF6AD
MAQHDQKFTVAYTTEQFPPDIPASGVLTFTPEALAHALFVTGRAPGDRTAYGLTSLYEWLHRTAVVPAYVRHGPNGELMRTNLAKSLDRSEKGALSYALGQAMTGIFSEQVMSVRFLMHIDRYAPDHQLTFAANTRQRADFFGRRRLGRGWVVAEAKGRSGPIEPDLLKKMQDQKRTVQSIAGVPPEVAYGCAAYFRQSSGYRESLAVHVVDPPEDEPDAIHLPVDLDRFIWTYYAPFLAALEEGRNGPSLGDYRVTTLGRHQPSVGILRPVIERLERVYRQERLTGLHDDVTRLLDEHISDDRAPNRFLDGTLVTTRWQAAMAQHDHDGMQWSIDGDFPLE